MFDCGDDDAYRQIQWDELCASDLESEKYRDEAMCDPCQIERNFTCDGSDMANAHITIKTYPYIYIYTYLCIYTYIHIYIYI